jgi:creatinine amidohydrolase
MREWVLAEQNHSFIRGQKWEVAVLPFGATEPHNLHMPYGTDIFQADKIGQAACERAYRAGAKAILLPTVPFGVNTNFLKLSGTITCSVTPTTLLHILTDIVDALERQGIYKLVLLNGHGGNELKPLMRELHHRSKVFLCLCDWFRMAADSYKDLFEHPGEHADEIETSMGLAYFPELVRLELADAGAAQPSRFDAINHGWISITRPWHLVSRNTGLGNPAGASAEKGRRLMEILAKRLGDFLAELAKSPLDDRFPY